MEGKEGISVMRGGRIRKLKQPTSSCSICLSKFQDQVLGSPDCCDHVFCLNCILKWAKTNKECPVDREHFENISISHKGDVICETVVQSPKKKKVMPVRYDFTTFCEVCNGYDRGHLISCDSCDLSYHAYCLKPEFQNKVPNSEWNCPTCFEVLKKSTYLTKIEAQQMKQAMKNRFVPEERSTATACDGGRVQSSSSLQLLTFDDFHESDENDTAMDNKPTSGVLQDAKPLGGRLLISYLYKHLIIFSDDGQLFYDMRDLET